MDRPSMAVGLPALGLALACSIAGCGTRHGTILTMTNDTSVTVTMKSCLADSAQPPQCTAVSRIAPGGSAEFPLSGLNTPLRQVVITGYGAQPRCFLIPPSNLPKNALVTVTYAQHSMCLGGPSSFGP
jgi:hypothetical protein